MSGESAPKVEQPVDEGEVTHGGWTGRSALGARAYDTSQIPRDPALVGIENAYHLDLEGMFSPPRLDRAES